MSLLSRAIEEPPLPTQPLLILQSSISQSSLPILRQLLSQNVHPNVNGSPSRFLLFCFSYPPADLLGSFVPEDLEVHNCLSRIPGYDDDWPNHQETILSAVRKGEQSSVHSLSLDMNAMPAAPSGYLNVIIDCLDTLLLDIGSIPQTYKLLSDVLNLLLARTSKSLVQSCPYMLTANM